ncbi:MAG: HAD-superfamily hydrolase, subfamily variant 3 [Candidatus Saccharibacteria bacterium]|nr:HAD-superfamily hydrolase, subfamily variant 3 [Candidatus Saccharibacteria bacterium]
MTSGEQKVSAIIFDCFGVLVSEGWLPFKHKYFDNDPDKFEEATNMQKRADAGLTDHAGFVKNVADLAGVSPEQAHQEIDNTVTDESLLNYIATLKTDYKIGFISNASQSWMKEFFTPGQIALFDAIDISSETGLLKPDARAFEHIAEGLGASVDECILIDDQEGYCEGARAIGMKAITYQNLKSMQQQLDAFLGR